MLLSYWLACTHLGGPDVSAEEAYDLADDGFPLAAPRDAALRARLAAAPVAEAHHRDADGHPTHVNRLVLERSAYLRQHAHNPVDWYPWGDEAFDRARALGKPVLLSVGYSTCHWCHVMEEESFEDPEIAAFINEHFVPVKVDREELPDVDAVYMAAVQALLRGRGGWPMTVFLTPDREPFHAATYLPPRDGDRGRSIGLLTVLGDMSAAWTERHDDVVRAGADLSAFVARQLDGATAPAELPPTLLAQARRRALLDVDPEHGGRKGAPKFPSGWPLRFAMDDVGADPSELAEPLHTTLDAMASRGLYDIVGGGFHRYTVDEAWRVPHFEKMLYDNALLAGIYLDAWRHFGDPAYAEVVRGTLRDQLARAPGPTFAAASDADSPAPGHEEPVEGGYYTFTPAEVRDALALVDLPGDPWVDQLGVDLDGPVDGRSPLAIPTPRALLDPPTREVLDALGAARERRTPPFVDPKAVVAWNGLMLSTLARTARFLDPDQLPTALALADALASGVRDGRLPRLLDGNRPGLLADEAFVARGFLDLFETTGDPRWLRAALERTRCIDVHFSTPEGGWYRTADDAPAPLARPRSDRDGAEPSGASVHVGTLLRLAAITGDDSHRARADQALAAYAVPLAAGDLDDMLPAVAWRLGRPLEIVVVAPSGQPHDATMLASVDEGAPWRHVRLLAHEDHPERLRGTVATGKLAHGGHTTVYVCEAGVCQAPVNDPEDLERVLGRAPRAAD